jgi:hypothetical protein
MKNKFLILSVFLVLLSSCSVRLTDFTVISTKNTNVKTEKKGNRVEGKDCSNLAFGIIPVTGTYIPNLKEAIDDAIEKGDGDILLDGVVYQKTIFIPLVFTQVCYNVEGTIGKTR